MTTQTREQAGITSAIRYVSDGHGGVRPAHGALTPGPGQVVLRTRYAGVNRGDVLGLAGAYGAVPDERTPLGQDIVGTVVGVGPEVPTALLGTTMWGQIRGAWADHAVADVASLAELGDLNPVVAASLPLAGFTAVRLLKDVRRTLGSVADREVLITGGTGAVGGLLTQLLSHAGARVWLLTRRAAPVTAASPDGRAIAGDAADDIALEERHVRWVARVEDVPPVDIAFESVGGNVTARVLGRLAPGGHAWWFGEVTRESVRLNFFDFLGSPWHLHHFSSWVHDGDDRAELAELARLVGDGVLTPPARTVIPARDLAAAVRAVRDGRQRDKVILDFADGLLPG